MRHSTKTSSTRASQTAGRSIIGACVLAFSVLACGPREKSGASDTTAASATTSATTSTTASADTTAAGTSATASTPAAAETTRQTATGEAAVATGPKHTADTTTHAADTTKHARKATHPGTTYPGTKKTDTTATAAATTTSAAAAPAPAAQPQQDTTARTGAAQGTQGTDTTKRTAQGTDTTKGAATTASGGKDPSCFQENGAKGVQPTKPGADPLAVSQSEYDGWKMWHVYCYRCHGVDAMGSDIAPNLRHSVGPDGTVNHTCYVATVTQGRLQKGMPSWRALLSDQQIEDVWAYLQARASGRLAAGRPHVAKTTSGS